FCRNKTTKFLVAIDFDPVVNDFVYVCVGPIMADIIKMIIKVHEIEMMLALENEFSNGFESTFGLLKMTAVKTSSVCDCVGEREDSKTRERKKSQVRYHTKSA